MPERRTRRPAVRAQHRSGEDWASQPAYDVELVDQTLTEARSEVLAELRRIFAARKRTGYGPLYDLLADYPFREGKGLRPAICLAACRAAGGRTEQALLRRPRWNSFTTHFSSMTT